MSKTLVFTATYNEKENIKKLIYDINKLNKDIDILVIDDSSPDKTWEILEQLERNLPNLKVIIRDGKSGLDTAHKLAFDYAKKNNYDKFISMDADLSHNPKLLNRFITNLNQNEFVIGSRYIKGGSCEINFFRFLLSFFGNKFIKFMLQIPSNEFTTSYRGFNLDKLKGFSLNDIKSKGYSFFMETIYLINKKNYKIKEIPIKFKNRIYGVSKIPKIEIIRTFLNVIRLKFRI